VKLWPTQLKVLEAIELHHPDGVPDKQIAKHTGLPLQSVCGRRNELVKAGLVESVGFDYFPDYNGMMRKNTLWALKA
jgi:predicted transcriptional regulator